MVISLYPLFSHFAEQGRVTVSPENTVGEFSGKREKGRAASWSGTDLLRLFRFFLNSQSYNILSLSPHFLRSSQRAVPGYLSSSMDAGNEQPAPVLPAFETEHLSVGFGRAVKRLFEPAFAAHEQHGLLDLEVTRFVFLGVGVHPVHGVLDVAAKVVPVERAAEDQHVGLFKQRPELLEVIFHNTGLTVTPTGIAIKATAHPLLAALKNIHGMARITRPFRKGFR